MTKLVTSYLMVKTPGVYKFGPSGAARAVSFSEVGRHAVRIEIEHDTAGPTKVVLIQFGMECEIPELNAIGRCVLPGTDVFEDGTESSYEYLGTVWMGSVYPNAVPAGTEPIAYSSVDERRIDPDGELIYVTGKIPLAYEGEWLVMGIIGSVEPEPNQVGPEGIHFFTTLRAGDDFDAFYNGALVTQDSNVVVRRVPTGTGDSFDSGLYEFLGTVDGLDYYRVRGLPEEAAMDPGQVPPTPIVDPGYRRPDLDL